jgi:hypothetical protein
MIAIQALSVGDFTDLVKRWVPQRTIDSVHLHCTDRPRHADFRGVATIEAMRRFHMGIGMRDIAQHLSIDPRGGLWSGRPFDQVPASARGHNGSSTKGPFMIEMVGLFDAGKDVLAGGQLKSTQAVICVLLRKFGLSESALKFHREFPNTGKTCPGNSLDPKAFRAEIKALLASNALRDHEVEIPAGDPRGDGAGLVNESNSRALGDVEVPFEADWDVPEDAEALAEIDGLSKLIARRELTTDRALYDRVEPEFRELIGHVVNTSQGALSSKGRFANDLDDLKVLVQRFIVPALQSGKFKHIVFYAHGGLVSEKSSLCYAKTILNWWKSYGAYPIFFTWESGLISTLSGSKRGLGARGLVEAITDFWDKAVEVSVQLAARPTWARMKENARDCSATLTKNGVPGGIRQFVELLFPALNALPNAARPTLHAVGHSTGPILLRYFMPLVRDQGWRFATLSYLAPAIRIDDFIDHVKPNLGPGGYTSDLCVYTMNDEAERDDSVMFLYRKSLLYFVRNACEDRDAGRILGLQKDLLDDHQARAFFGIKNGKALSGASAIGKIEFSQPRGEPQNANTDAREHGAFDNNRATMLAVLERILGVAPHTIATGIKFPTDTEFKRCKDADPANDRGPSDGGDGDCDCGGGPSTSPFDLADGELDVAALPSPTRRARQALCIGIDGYPGNAALSGCVNDARAWAKKLTELGFNVRTLVNQSATLAGIRQSIGELIASARPGDELVVQFAGHGTQVEDLNGDEDDRFDEALVPVDFKSGALLLDDDIDALVRQLPVRAHLTFLMDCCHSGSNVRAAPLQAGALASGARNRFLKLDAESAKAFRAARGDSVVASSRGPKTPAPGVMSVAACLDREVALERGGQGDFTRHALAVIDASWRQRDSNRRFLNAVLRQFGANREQNPTLLKPAAAGLPDRAFLGGRER